MYLPLTKREILFYNCLQEQIKCSYSKVLPKNYYYFLIILQSVSYCIYRRIPEDLVHRDTI